MYTPPVIDYLQYVDINNGTSVDVSALTTEVNTLKTNVQNINDRTRYVYCKPGIGCSIRDNTTNVSVDLYASKFVRN